MGDELTYAEHRDLMEKRHLSKGLPNAEKCYSLAYEYGHAYGYLEVESFYSDLVELIKPINPTEAKER